MKTPLFFIGLICLSGGLSAQNTAKVDTTKVQEIEDILLHKTGNPNNARLFSAKTNLTVMENPQPIAIVTHEIIEQQQAKQLSDVLQNVNGLYVTSSRGNSQASFGGRGFVFGNDNMFKNGARVNSGVFPEVSGLERVEVLKGANAMLFGNVAAGGVVNMVTKKPRFNFGGNASFSAGSWDTYKPTIDFYGPLSEHIAFRVNGAYEKANSYRDVVSSEKYYFNPSFLFNLGKKSQLIVEGDYLKNNFTPDFGIGSIENADGTYSLATQLSRNAFLGTNWQYQNVQQTTTDIIFNHEFNKHWYLNSVVSYQNYVKDYYSTERIQWKTDSDNRIYWKRPLNKTYDEQNYASAQININGEFHTGKIHHKVLVGTDADLLKADRYYYNNPTSLNTIYMDDVSSWESPEMPDAQKTKRTRIPSQRFGVYAQDYISLSQHFKVLAGLRWSYLETDATENKIYIDGTNPTNAVKTVDRAFSPKAGLVYMPNDNLSIYGTYTNSFSPNSGFSAEGPLKPSIIDQYEIGLKKNLWNNAVAFNISAYQIENNNTYQTSETDSTLKEYAGKMRSRGVELDITGNPYPNLSLIGGFSYNHSVYTDTPDEFGYIENQRLVRTPATTVNASAFYTLPQFIKGLKVGATFYYIGNRIAGWNDTKTREKQGLPSRLVDVDDYTTLDLSLGYEYKKFIIQGKLGNIFNTLNYIVHENYSVNPIAPRNVYFTLTYKL